MTIMLTGPNSYYSEAVAYLISRYNKHVVKDFYYILDQSYSPSGEGHDAGAVTYSPYVGYVTMTWHIDDVA